jgi:cell division protein YceG involved in septum cleavage
MLIVIVIALSVAGISTAATTALTRSAAPVRANGDEPEEVTLTIAEGETVAEIAHKLRANGLIRNSLLFRLIALQRGLGQSLQPGTYTLTHEMSMYEILTTLQRAPPK